MKPILLILLFLILLLSACAPAVTQAPMKTAEPVQAQSTEVSSSSALFQIIKSDGTKFDVTLDAVKELPLAQVTVEGKVQEGPKLLDVLSLAGVTDL